MISLAKHFVYRPQLCLTVCDPMDCSLPGSSVHGILHARILELVAVPFSRGSSQPRDWTQVSHFADSYLSEPPGMSNSSICYDKNKFNLFWKKKIPSSLLDKGESPPQWSSGVETRGHCCSIMSGVLHVTCPGCTINKEHKWQGVQTTLFPILPTDFTNSFFRSSWEDHRKT